MFVQGGTIGPLLRLITPKADPEAAEAKMKAERDRIFQLLRSSAETIPEPPHPEGGLTPESFGDAKRYRLEVIGAQRAALLDARDNGTFDADVLADALANLDASQIDIELRGTLVS